MNNTDHEIGIALSHYHQKLGPQFVVIAFDFTKFDNVAQYNILQDSISTRSNDLALFLSTKDYIHYIIRIKKIKILDSQARGGVQRYALIFLLPNDIHLNHSYFDEIYKDIQQKLNQGKSVRQTIQSWHQRINEQFGFIRDSEKVEIVKRFGTTRRSTQYDLL